jgi:hypothetical protein
VGKVTLSSLSNLFFRRSSFHIQHDDQQADSVELIRKYLCPHHRRAPFEAAEDAIIEKV